MATRNVSPGAALLRTSRLFSLPNQLPPPPDIYAVGARRPSPTATKAYPTMQAITTPKAALKNGDWGLKRPLPSKLAVISNRPLVRVNEIDSIENVTDYATASDHAMTLRKWQELNVPITLQTDAEQRQHLAGKSVFEEHADVISIDPAKKHTAEDKRWKFEGPWLAGINDGAFQKYLKKKVRPRRAEFRDFLRTHAASDVNRAATAKAMDEGRDAPAPVAASDITDAQLTDYLRELRSDRPLLYRLVGKFLDLAPIEPSDKVFSSLARTLSPNDATPSNSMSAMASLAGTGGSNNSFLSMFGRGSGNTGGSNPWAQDGPPITHPSAGLSYLRSSAFIDNHPLYGPQKTHPPVQARVVMPRSPNGSSPARLGVAGFIAENAYGDTAYNTRYTRGMPGLNIIDPKVVGGAKISVRVSAAKVNSQGMVMVSVTDPDPEAVLVQKELSGEEKIFGQPGALQSTRGDGRRRGYSPSTTISNGRLDGNQQNSFISSAQNYGLGKV